MSSAELHELAADLREVAHFMAEEDRSAGSIGEVLEGAEWASRRAEHREKEEGKR